MPIMMSVVQDSLQAVPIVFRQYLSYCLKRRKNEKGHGFYEVPAVPGRLGANGELANILGATASKPSPLAPSLTRARKSGNIFRHIYKLFSSEYETSDKYRKVYRNI